MKPGTSITLLRAALYAATSSTLVEVLLWWLHGEDVVRNFYRDTRLTATIVMSEHAAEPLIMGAATLVHLFLSLVYTAMLAALIHRLSPWPAILAGAVFGLLLYGINLYGFTALFPWFIPVRGAITLVAHLTFGVTVGATCRRAHR